MSIPVISLRAFLLISANFLCSFSYAQPPVDRYQSDLFSSVTETNDLLFSEDVVLPLPGGGFWETVTGFPLNVDEFSTTTVDLRMDVFEPTGDTLTERPLIIICFGGGFLAGSREHWSIRLLCQDLAKRGFVTAAIDYRLGMNIFDSDLAMRAVYRGIQDGRSAVRFFRADANGANQFRIDPDNIFIGGHSAGAFIATHNAYLDKESERPISTYNWSQEGNLVPDQLCLDCVGDNLEYSGHANAIFSLAGAVGFTNLIEGPTDPNVVMFHSLDDDTVPYYSGEPFGSILWLVPGSDLPEVFGSDSMATQGNLVGLNYDFNMYQNRGHGVHESGSSALHSEIVPKIGDWFYQETLKPLYSEIQGDSIVCSSELEQQYSLVGEGGRYFNWQIVGGAFLQMSTDSSAVTVEWDSLASNHSLKVTAYSELDAASDSLISEINIYISDTNHFLGKNSTWELINNWALDHLPSICEDVEINTANGISALDINSKVELNSIILGPSMTLTIKPAAELNIYQKIAQIPLFGLEIEGLLINEGMTKLKSKIEDRELKLSDGQLENKAGGTLEIYKK